MSSWSSEGSRETAAQILRCARMTCLPPLKPAHGKPSLQMSNISGNRFTSTKSILFGCCNFCGFYVIYPMFGLGEFASCYEAKRTLL
jgi:hypothetical protein